MIDYPNHPGYYYFFFFFIEVTKQELLLSPLRHLGSPSFVLHISLILHIYYYAGEVMVKSNFTLPDDMRFGEAQIMAITAYSIMFIIGFVLNSMSLYQLLMERLTRKNRTRMSLLLIHLAVADLMVTILRYH